LDTKIRVGAVSYLNTQPLIYGIKRSPLLMQHIELTEEYPSKIAGRLLNDEIDVGLVPVAVIPHMKQHYIVGDYCIGAEGKVMSVALFSNVPMEQIETVLLDYQSRTSVALAKVLFKHYWKKEVVFKPAAENFEKEINGTTAAVIIGDRALVQRKEATYIFDLADAWKSFTGLPFVFAAWISNKKLDDDWIGAFNKANAYGLNHLEEVLANTHFEHYDLRTYYTKDISYPLTNEKRKGLEKFISFLKEEA
jgi:Predicted periplasmic solute-binding protein